MSSKNQERKSTSRLTQGLLAAAVAALVAMPVAFANGADGPVASKSASVRQQVKSLKKRIAALESRQSGPAAQNTTARPVGPAGGDLTGTYPNPTIGPDKVTSAKVAPDTLLADDLAPQSVGASEIVDNSIGQVELGIGSIGNVALNGIHTVVGGGTTVSNNTASTTTISCPAGEQMITGGYAWGSTSAGLTVTANAPGGNPGEFFTQWVVTGRNTSGSSANLFPWATCLVN